jgi:hypothetical protein
MTPTSINTKTQNRINTKDLKRTPTERGSYYINHDVLTQLDMVQLKVRQFLPQTSRGDLNKSKLVELALQLVFEDVEAYGERAALVRRLKRPQ